MNVLFLGKEGFSMLPDALDLATQTLETDHLDNHPDYLFVDLPDGKKSIGVDEISPIVRKGSLKPVLAKKAVVVINHMDCLTDVAQNKLLLTLESSDNVRIIGIAYKDTLLATVKSRMSIRVYRPCIKSEFCSLTGCAEEDSELMYYATGGCPGLYYFFSESTTLFRELFDICMGKDLSPILKVLHLVKEKDPLAIHEDKKLLLAVLHVMQYAFIQKAYVNKSDVSKVRYASIVERLVRDESLCMSPNYTKHDFFLTVTIIIENGGI
jgi:hypothetical protein